MAYKVKRPCRVCGKLFTPCTDCENDKTAFHWRTIACSYECAIAYLKKVQELRKNESDSTPNQEASVLKEISDSNKEKVNPKTRKMARNTKTD